MTFHYEWRCTQNKRKLKNICPRFEVSTHPMKTNINVCAIPSKTFIDHLNKWSAGFEEVDPLLRFEQMQLEDNGGQVEKVNRAVSYSKAWDHKRINILNKYTTGEKLTIVSSFLPGGEKTLIRQVSNLNEKVKHRLEQLDDFDEDSVRKTMGLSQQEFVTKINMLNDEIKKAWDSEQRVKAFKIGIQCSKLLSDITVMQFYPSKFILITDILNTFGNLVYGRLKHKSYGDNPPEAILDIDPNDIPESAKETCQNWMYKMASIRELLPRLYMEISLLKCYVFLSKDDIRLSVKRITKMIRGIGNPIVAVYVRVYLCYMASSLLGEKSNEVFYNNLTEFLDEIQQVYHGIMKKKYETQLLTLDKYLSLYVPAVDWLIYGCLHSTMSKTTLLDELLRRCVTMSNNEIFLYCLISNFDTETIIEKSSELMEMIQNSAENMVLLSDILASFGEHLCAADKIRQIQAESLIKSWWKITGNIRSTVNFLQILEPWLQFACTHLSVFRLTLLLHRCEAQLLPCELYNYEEGKTQHVNIILRGIIRYMVKCGKPADEFTNNFQFVIKRMLKSIPDVEELFLMDAFMPLVELVQTSTARTTMAKTVLSIFFSRYNSVHIEDHIVINCLLRLCCILHDSINAVTVEDEVKLCSDLINKFVQAVTYQDDLEQQLNFYVECRSSFIKLDEVLETLVHAVNALAARADPIQARWLQRACAAYCFVTVPSLHCTLTKSHLYLLSGQVALLNNCIGQAEANFKAFIVLIPDIPKYIMEDGQKKVTNIKVGSMLSDFLSTLLILPDNVDSNCKCYILSGFIKTMERIHWEKTDPLYYTTLLRVLDLLNEMAQESYVYHVDSVLSNDKLYGCDEEFIDAIEKYASSVCQELLVVLKRLEDNKETQKQYNLALELFWRVIRRSDLGERSMFSLAVNLWMLAQKLQDSNNNITKSILSALQNDDRSISQRLLQKLKESVKNA